MAGLSPDANQPPKNIFEASERGNHTYVARLIQRSIGFDVNQTDHLNRTALHWAAELGHVKVAEVLVDYEINQFSKECNGRTALHLAARAGDAAMIETLLGDMDKDDAKKLVNEPDNYGLTAVYLALKKGDEGRAAFDVLTKYGGAYSVLAQPQVSTPIHALCASPTGAAPAASAVPAA